jgi:hypothetical protein
MERRWLRLARSYAFTGLAALAMGVAVEFKKPKQ